MARIALDQDNVLAPEYENAIKQSEGSADGGWDFKQFSGPYGVKRGPNEALTDDQALARFHDELANANAMVKSLGVPMSPGKEAALTSLTYNAGPKWMQSGLGQAVRNGDWDTARNLFLQYNHAGGQENDGLRRRRNQEATWFDQDDGTPTAPVTGGSGPAPDLSGISGDGPVNMAQATPPPAPAPEETPMPAPKASPDFLGAQMQTPTTLEAPQNPAAPLVSKAQQMLEQAKGLTPNDLPGLSPPDSQDRVQQALAMARAATPFRSKVSPSIIPSLEPEDTMPHKSSKKSSSAFMADGGVTHAMYGPEDRQSDNVEDRRNDGLGGWLGAQTLGNFQGGLSNLSRHFRRAFAEPMSPAQLQAGLDEVGNLLPRGGGSPYGGPAYTTPETMSAMDDGPLMQGGESLPLAKLQGRLSDEIGNHDDDVEHFAFGGPTWFAKSEARGMTHAGPLLSAVPGRTDKLPVSVKAGSFVMPADSVSALGQGNTAAGNKVLSGMFNSGPFGMPTLHGSTSFKGAKAPKMPSVSQKTTTSTFKGPKLFADGGAPEGGDSPVVPIIAAGGEYIIPPEHVAQLGNGDLDQGHAILNQWVQDIRQNHIHTLANLPPPAK